MYISNIRLVGNEDGELGEDTLYAELCHSGGTVAVYGTLVYILAAIRDRKYPTENVTVKWTGQHSTVSLELPRQPGNLVDEKE